MKTFKKTSLGSKTPVEITQDKIFLRQEFYDYVKDLKKESTAESYANKYLKCLFNNLPLKNDEPRKWIVMLPHLLAIDWEIGKIVITYWQTALNNYIVELKKNNESSKVNTFRNYKSALNTYYSFLSTKNSDEIDLPKMSKVKGLNTLIKNIKLQHLGPFIYERKDLIDNFVFRMESEDRFPEGDNAVYYPARIIKKALKTDFEDLAKKCIRNLIVFTTSGNYKLKDLDGIKIQKNRIAVALKGDKEYVILNEDSMDSTITEISVLLANSQEDLSREHILSIGKILKGEIDSPIKWKSLGRLKEMIDDVFPSRKGIIANTIKREVLKRYEKEIMDMKEDIYSDVEAILERTKFSLMQKNINSSKNEHF